MRRLAAALCGLALAGLMTGTALAAPAAPTRPALFSSCSAGIGVTYSGTLIRHLKPSPEGPVNNILGGENFVVQCQPLSGSVTIQLQFRSGSNWVNAGGSDRHNFPSTIRGFGLVVGDYYCQGTKTSWRIAIFSSGVAGDGTVIPPTTSWDSAIGGSAGKYFNCG